MTAKELLKALSIYPVHAGFLKMYLDGRGRILGPTESPGWKVPPLLWIELSEAGNIHRHFDLSPGPALENIPVWTPDRPEDQVTVYFNKKGPPLTADPDPFFTSLPTLILSVLRLEKNLFAGIIRPRSIMPNLSLGGSGCIVFTDARDRLAGFSRTFLGWIDPPPGDPMTLLGQPIIRYFRPGPREMMKQQLLLDPVRGLEMPPPRLAVDFSVRGPGDIHCTRPECVSRTSRGLSCRNPGEDFIYFSLPEAVDTRLDFRLTLELEMLKGPKPSVFLTCQPDPGLYAKNSPDADGYQLGVRADLGRFIVKRRAMLQIIGGADSPSGTSAYEFYKIGDTLRLFENGKARLEYGDLSFIHHPAARLVLGIRGDSVCLLRRLSLSQAEPARSPETGIIPIVHFDSPAAQAALLTRIDNSSLVNNHPEISAWVLQNITRMEAQMTRLLRENRRLQQAAGAQGGDFIGASRAMTQVRENAARVAASGATVLLQGPTGSGKEVVARYIHERSGRRDMPFVKVDCSVIPPSLMESELFGHEKGAFTGAGERRIGRFEQARGGTVFLDEAGNLSPEAQAKLLHFLQDRSITRVGGRETVKLDVRVIVASNVPLADLVRKGLFREDLFYRIDVVSIPLPRLADRLDDLPELTAHFLDLANRAHNRSVKGLTPAAHRKIAGHRWPGNVRELRNTMERAVLFCASDTIDAEDIVFSMQSPARRQGGRGPYRRTAVSPDRIRQAIREQGGNLKAAAAALGVPRRTLYNRLARLGLRPDQVRKS